MNGIPPIVWMAGCASLSVIVLVYAIFVLQRRRDDLVRSASPDQEPAWTQITPAPAAAQLDDEVVEFRGGGPKEGLALPFVEQIEAIVQARLGEDPSLAAMRVDFRTAPDGGLEIVVNGEVHAGVGEIADRRLQGIIRQAVASWEQEKQEK